MKNVVNERPDLELSGRLKFTSSFVNETDIHDKQVLDVGCGFGWFELLCLDNNVKQVLGIEHSEIDLETARKYILDEKVSFEVGSAIQIPAEDNSFDTVVSWEVIEHIPYGTEHLMFSEVNRVLRRGGKFYLSTPFNSIPSKLADPAYWIQGHRHYKFSDLEKLANAHGFKVVKHSVVGSWWVCLNLLNMYFSKWVLRKPKRMFAEFFDRKSSAEYSTGNGFVNIFVIFEKVDN